MKKEKRHILRPGADKTYCGRTRWGLLINNAAPTCVTCLSSGRAYAHELLPVPVPTHVDNDSADDAGWGDDK